MKEIKQKFLKIEIMMLNYQIEFIVLMKIKMLYMHTIKQCYDILILLKKELKKG